jgi:hypothetical protein
MHKILGLRGILVTILLLSLFAACSDDDPTAGTSPCLDDDTSCLTVRATADQMTYTSNYDPMFDLSEYSYVWTTAGEELADFRPGQHVTITLVFSPPLEVLYDHADQSTWLVTAPPACGSGFVRFDGTSSVSGNWPAPTPTVDIEGCATGTPRLRVINTTRDLKTGQELRSLTCTFTVPDTYESGGDAGETIPSGNLTVVSISTGTSHTGPLQGPPIWPKGAPLP